MGSAPTYIREQSGKYSQLLQSARSKRPNVGLFDEENITFLSKNFPVLESKHLKSLTIRNLILNAVFDVYKTVGLTL